MATGLFHFKCNDNLGTTAVLDALSLNAGILSGANTEDVSETGKINSAFNLGSPNSYITFSDNSFAEIGTGVLTFALWFKISSISGEKILVAKRAWSTDPEPGYSIGFTNSTTLRVHYYNDQQQTVPDIADSNWHHLVVSFNYTDAKHYTWLDGSYIGSSSHTQNSTTNSNILRIGNSTAFGLYWTGYVDDVRLYTDIFSDDIVAFLYNSGFGTENEYSPRIDSYTKLLLHCNGTDGSTIFLDSSTYAHSVTANGTAQIDTAQSKFGGASGLFNGSGDLSVPDSDDWNFSTGDFTIDFWVRFNSLSVNDCIISPYDNGSDRCYISVGDNNCIEFYASSGGSPIAQFKTPIASITTNQWYHIALVRSGANEYIFINGISQTLTYIVNPDASTNYPNVSSVLRIGRQFYGWYFNGWLDEIRVSKGIARWISDFTPPSYEYGVNIPIEEDELIGLIDTASLVGKQLLEVDDILELTDEVHFPIIQNTESFIITDEINFISSIITKFQTQLNTLLYKSGRFATNLTVGINLFNRFATKLNLLYRTNQQYDTDLRVRYDDYDSIPPKSLDDILVKLDNVNLTDVDYNSLRITFNLNSTPSRAEFLLARRHDNIDKKLNGTTSVISNENKITIYDGDNLIFTGYISELDLDSESDTVRVIVEDVRYKLANNSMELWYGGQWEQDEDNEEEYNKYEKNIGQAYQEVISAIGSLISSYDTLPFSGSFVPEYVKTYNTYASLLDELIRNTANANWYIDASERLRINQVSQGQIINLPLASLNSKRHLYQVVLNRIHLNRKTSSYAKSLTVKRGKYIEKTWNRATFSGILTALPIFLARLAEKTVFCFQYFLGKKYYVGMNQTIYGYSTGSGWVLKPEVVVQYPGKDIDRDLSDITVGSGSPRKTIFLTSYGQKIVNSQWQEKSKTTGDTSKSYLVSVIDESYDRRNFLQDLANFELAQNNQLITTAEVTLILDAFHYYGIHFKSRINLVNTIQEDIYKNNNGFPLNIDSYTIDCATRLVTLNLTNYGKSWYAKTGNYMTNYKSPTTRYMYEKVPVIRFSQF